jgi:hypothetical protein
MNYRWIMKRIFIIIPLILFINQMNGQESPGKNYLSVYYGVGNIIRQDLVFSPLVHRDISFINAGLGYTREADIFQRVNFSYSNFTPMVADSYGFFDRGELKTAGPHLFTLVDMDYLGGKVFLQTGKAITILGGLFSADVQALNYVYGRIGNFGYFSSLGMGLFARQGYFISDKSFFSATIQLPIFSWISRSPYLVNDDEFIENISSHSDFKTFLAFIRDGSFNTISQFQAIDIEAEYLYGFHERWEVGASYNLAILHSRIPREMISIRSSISLSLNFIF